MTVADPSIPSTPREDVSSPTQIAVVGSGYVGTVVACCFAVLVVVVTARAGTAGTTINARVRILAESFMRRNVRFAA